MCGFRYICRVPWLPSDTKLYWSIGRINCLNYSTRVDLYSHQILLLLTWSFSNLMTTWIPWNSTDHMELGLRQFWWHDQIHGVPWNSMEPILLLKMGHLVLVNPQWYIFILLLQVRFELSFFTRGQFWPSGIVVTCMCMCLSICLSVRGSVNRELVRTIIDQRFKLGSPNLDQIELKIQSLKLCESPWNVEQV